MRIKKNNVIFAMSKNNPPTARVITILSAKGDLKICQVVDPQKTCRFEISQSLAKQLSITI